MTERPRNINSTNVLGWKLIQYDPHAFDNTHFTADWMKAEKSLSFDAHWGRYNSALARSCERRNQFIAQVSICMSILEHVEIEIPSVWRPGTFCTESVFVYGGVILPQCWAALAYRNPPHSCLPVCHIQCRRAALSCRWRDASRMAGLALIGRGKTVPHGAY